MKHGCWMTLLAILAAGAIGCGKNDSPTPQAGSVAAEGLQPELAPPKRPDGNGPDVAVFDFLEAVRAGNDEKAGQMLTPLARQKVAEQHMVVAPPGTDTARFDIGRVEPVSDDVARVVINWTDVDESGKPRSDEVAWVLRRTEEGWRIAGAAVPIFDGEPPLVLNFEDPEDMLKKQKLVREEIQRRMEEANRQATNPEKPVQR